MGGRDPANFIAPGFRFHPTDEELVKFYLKRKVCGRAFRFDAIAEADVYKCEPWDLPDKSALKSRDLEWYFFSGLDKKYGHGSKTNRATERGYWKTTGKDRPVHNNLVVVGMKKTLVYHIGRAPRGERTNWVMHEYRLADSELEKAGVSQASFVLCRIFQKSGPGPKNGEQHGAPFIEEEWEDEDEVLVTGGEQSQDEALIADGAYLETDDLDQLIDFNVSPGNYSLQTNYCYGGSSNQFEVSRELSEEGQKPSVGAHENLNQSKLPVTEQQCFGELKPYEVEENPPMADYFAKPDDIASHDVNYLLDEPYLNGNYDEVHREGLYLETEDLLTPIEADPSSFDMLHEYLADFDENDEIFYMPPNNSKAETETDIPLDIVNEQAEGQTQKLVMASKHLVNAHGGDDDGIASSNQNCTKFGSGSKNPVAEHAKCLLESIPAPPAFAAEFPSKDAALRLASAMQSQNSVNVVANMMHPRNTGTANNGLSWSFDKNGKVQLIFSLSVGQGSGRLDPAACLDGYLSSKSKSATWRCWIYLTLFWVSILVISMKIGTCVVDAKQ
uniref:NAC domain-containing protein n=1 Tax=Kalanchoe fedtschenkoi TaxID=63787 RepID=A0A7N0RHB0_KALFE